MTQHERNPFGVHTSGEIFSKTMSYEELLHAEQILMRAMQKSNTPKVIKDIYTKALGALYIQMQQKK